MFLNSRKLCGIIATGEILRFTRVFPLISPYRTTLANPFLIFYAASQCRVAMEADEFSKQCGMLSRAAYMWYFFQYGPQFPGQPSVAQDSIMPAAGCIRDSFWGLTRLGIFLPMDSWSSVHFVIVSSLQKATLILASCSSVFIEMFGRLYPAIFEVPGTCFPPLWLGAAVLVWFCPVHSIYL